MRLEIESIDINDVQPGEKTHAEDRILYVNTRELEELILQDGRIKSVDIDIVRPGDKVRIVNLMDVVQPRCKIDEFEADFPGFVGRLRIAGSGRTRSLRGVAVLVSNPCTQRKYSAFLDMAGLCARMSRYAKLTNVSIAPRASAEVEDRDFEDAVKIAGFKTAVYLALAAKEHAVDEREIYELDVPRPAKPVNCPRVAYYFQLYTPQHDHRGISDPCFYGTQVRNFLPTVIHPNEVLDGGVVGHNTMKCLDTYTIQNHAIIKELYRRHGKDLIFVGVVMGVANVESVARKRQAIMAASLIKNVLGADGVAITKVHGGMPHVDIALVAEECEKLGVKTGLFVQPVATAGSLGDTLLFNNEALDLILTTGGPHEKVKLDLKVERILGGTAGTKIFSADPIEQHAGDKTIEVEEQLIAGVLDQLGGASIMVREY